MFALKLFLGVVFLASSSARFVDWEDDRHPQGFYDGRHRIDFDEEDPFLEREYEPCHSCYYPNTRVRRQVDGSVTLNSDGSMGLGAKVPITGNEKNQLSAIGSIGLNNQLQPASRGVGLALDNVNGHSLTVMKENVPGYGDKLTGAGQLHLFHNDNHDVSARGFVTKNMPDFPHAPNYNTVGGGVDYMYKNKVGASLGMAHTPFEGRKDYSAMGNLNIFRSPTSALDFSGGFRKFDTPHMRSNWEPNFGFTYSRYFGQRF